MSVLRLAIPSPLRRYFDYLPPTGMAPEEVESLQPGIRLRVPFGRREVTGYLVAVCAETEVPQSALKPALEVLDADAFQAFKETDLFNKELAASFRKTVTIFFATSKSKNLPGKEIILALLFCLGNFVCD